MPDPAARSPWFPFPSGHSGPGQTRLYCVPPAGSGATLYLPWCAAMAEFFDVRPVQLPGHETRRGEPALTRIEPLAEALADAIEAQDAYAETDYAILGHSFGALVAFETARVLQARGAAAPLFLAASGSRAPHQRARVGRGDGGVEFLRRAGGTPPEVLADEELMALILPALRADLEAGAAYQRTSKDRVLIPIAALGGRSDPFVAPTDVASWAAHTADWCSVTLLDGGHFFLVDAVAAVCSRLALVLAQTRSVRTPG